MEDIAIDKMCFSTTKYLSRVADLISDFVLNRDMALRRLVDDIYNQSISSDSESAVSEIFLLNELIGEPTGIIQGGISVKYQSSKSIPLAYKCLAPKEIYGDALKEYRQRHEFILSNDFFSVGFDEPMEQFFYSKSKKKRIACIQLLGKECLSCPCIASSNFFNDDEVQNIKKTVHDIVEDCKTFERSKRYEMYAERLRLLCETSLKGKIGGARKRIHTFINEILRTSLNRDEEERLTITVLQSMVWNWLNGDQCKYVYYIADSVSSSSFSSGLCLVSECELNQLLLDCLALLTDRFFGTIYFLLTSKRVSIAHTKSAIGSIMSRNGSHNIGSHVLSALSHNIGTMPDDRMLYQYIQHRMDYIASATTGAPDWSVPTPFVGNLMKMFYSQRHLLEHIAESDGLHAYLYQGKGTKIGAGQKNCVKIVVRKISRRKGELVGEEKKEVISKDVFGKTIYMYAFFHDEADYPVKWANDESVSIPGGILGQHAFYNIVENVLRNAAKHSWAGKSKEEREKAGNLEIFVDFEKNLPDGAMCFTVGDNMSKLFQADFWTDFFAKNPNIQSAFADPLDGFEVPPDDKNSNRKKLKDFLEGKTSSDDLPWQYKCLYDYILLHWCDLIMNDSFKAALQGIPNKNENGVPDDSKPGYRLPLPLHHRQEMALAKPFIDLKTNRLRQSAWGLSEMKISAGYLRRADVSVIGGLEQPKPGEHPLIVPLGVPRGKVEHNKETHWDDFCLAYRFWVKLPKDILIVVDNASYSFWGTKVEGWDGIDVKKYDEVLGSEVGVGKMSDYGFVIVDYDKDIEKDSKLKLPFRTLATMDKFGLPCVPKSEIENARTRQALVECVYRAWLGYLKRRRYGKDGRKDLTIRLKIFEKKGGEKGLVSDRDIYKVLFRECLHSVLEPLVDKPDEKLTEQQRQALLLISLYPIDEADEIFEKNVEEQFKSEGDYPVATKKLLGEIADRVLDILKAEPDISNRPSRVKVFCAWRAGLESREEIHSESLIPLLEFVRDDTHSAQIPSGLMDVLSDVKDCSLPWKALTGSHSLLLDMATRALETARTTSEVFLRKYEERITTLPRQYRGIGLPEEPVLPFDSFGVSITFAEAKSDISYLRHSIDDSALYSEPLSGAQCYLNALSNLSKADSQWAMRLAENGLLRIVVIDERVRKFIVDHGKEIKKTYEAMCIAVVDTEKKPELGLDVSSIPDFNDCEKWKYVAGNPTDPKFAGDFDLVIIHQGIIDKWWPSKHNKKDVATILNVLRHPKDASQSRFVVVTTGRGRPDNIPETAKVLAFSSIEAFLFKRYPEKLNLVNSLMNILPGSPERNDDND